jgi:CDP-diacylglycerol--glycerol-3-phosphate 3-phosphatidyltransferase/cardiolipin synthase
MAPYEEPPPAPKLFSAEELCKPPNLMTLLRVPLALAFPFAAGSRTRALTVLALAGLTDVLDGYLARHSGELTATGALLDPIADKVFAISVVSTLVAQGKLPCWGIPALSAREVLEAPLFLYVLHEARRGSPPPVTGVRALRAGKLATVAQFAAVVTALELPALLPLMLVVAGVTGTVAGIAYWRRELERRDGRASKSPAR